MTSEKSSKDMEIAFLGLIEDIHLACMKCGMTKSFDLHDTYIKRALHLSTEAYGLVHLNARENGVNIDKAPSVLTYAENIAQIAERTAQLPAPTASEMITLAGMFYMSARKAETAAERLKRKLDNSALPDSAMASSLCLTEFILMANHITAAVAVIEAMRKEATPIERKSAP